MDSFDKLYDILKASADSTGLPILNSSQFIALTEEYTKKLFRTCLAEYITKEKPPYPLKKFDQEKVVRNFHKLKQADWTKFIMFSDKEVI